MAKLTIVKLLAETEKLYLPISNAQKEGVAQQNKTHCNQIP